MGGNFGFHGLHLWYLMDLFVFSRILLSLFITGGKTGESLIARASWLFVSPWALLLLFVPVAATSLLADLTGLDITRMMGSWDMLFFIY